MTTAPATPGVRVHVQTLDLCQPATITGTRETSNEPLYVVQFDDGGHMAVAADRLHYATACEVGA